MNHAARFFVQSIVSLDDADVPAEELMPTQLYRKADAEKNPAHK